MDIQVKLQALGWTLPEPVKPVAAYVPVKQAGDMLYISGQLPMRGGKLLATGAVPSAVSVEQAGEAAGQCVVNALAAIHAHLNGDWSRFMQVVRVGVFVQSDNGCAGQPQVANGASELLAKVFGEAGRHARAAVGVNALPLNACVEVELTVQIRV
ncbi:MAG: RidA family protein [Phycisphaeraceae bacterium]|nr:RidA family protein [Phycisphaeraceae bacterium]